MTAHVVGDNEPFTGATHVPGYFTVTPGPPLHGVVRIGGAKNAVLKQMAACLLAEGTSVIENVPEIDDVACMADVLGAMGVKVRWRSKGTIEVDTTGDIVPEAPYELVERMRASVVVLGPLLARRGFARVSVPGGDDFGHRPIDMHLHGLAEMGAGLETVHGYVVGRVPRSAVPGAGASTANEGGRLHGARIVLDYPSHTVTDNLLMAATLARGTTIIENAAREPEVADLAGFLTTMGAQIEGAGTSRIVVAGADELRPAMHRVIPDRVEAATFLAAVGLAGGDVVLDGARADHMEMLVAKLARMGLTVESVPEGLRARSESRLRSVDVATLPYPGVATDYKPFLVTMLTVADGAGIVTENLFPGRFRYVDELRRMGADIRTEGHHAIVRGVLRLSGAPVRAPDIRAGAALVLAGLVAEGSTDVAGAHHIDRGYEDFAGKLAGIGARVARVAGDAQPR